VPKLPLWNPWVFTTVAWVVVWGAIQLFSSVAGCSWPCYRPDRLASRSQFSICISV